VLRGLQATREVRDSRLFRLLHPLSPESVVAIYARGDALVRERVVRFLSSLAGVRLAVSGRDLIELGATPGDGFSAILARALDDRLDGRDVGRVAELANLERLARKAGLIGHRKDTA
jgi:tRNA nucleotidyltransferase (CCA-adding enzyme)